MMKLEQNDLVQHKCSKNVYRVVNTGVLTNSVLLELYPTFDTIEVTLEEISRDYIKIEGSLVAPNVKVIHKQTNLCLRLDGALPDKIKSHDTIRLYSCQSNACDIFPVEEFFHDFIPVVDTMNFIEAITFLVNNPSKSVVRTSYSAKAKETVQFYIKDIGGEQVLVTQNKNEAPQRRHIVSDIDEKFEVYTGFYSRYDESAIKAEFEKLEKEVKPFLEKVERYKQLKKELNYDKK